MTAEEMWQAYTEKYGIKDAAYSAWSFGGAPDLLADLVLQGKKTATASAYDLYSFDQEMLPKQGDCSVILNREGQAKCIIRTTKLYVVPFDQVSAEHAAKEGEGDLSLAYWREVHQEYFSNLLPEYGLSFSPKMKVLCEEFTVVYREGENQ
jgi:uncharacterized protein YhfF